MFECGTPPCWCPCCGWGTLPGNASSGKPLGWGCWCPGPWPRLTMWVTKGMRPCPMRPPGLPHLLLWRLPPPGVYPASWLNPSKLNGCCCGMVTFWMGGMMNAGAAMDGGGMKDFAAICCMMAVWLAHNWLIAVPSILRGLSMMLLWRHRCSQVYFLWLLPLLSLWSRCWHCWCHCHRHCPKCCRCIVGRTPRRVPLLDFCEPPGIYLMDESLQDRVGFDGNCFSCVEFLQQ